MFAVLIAGLIFGFVGAMPIAGPIAILVVSRTLGGRYKTAQLIGLGCAAAEGIYAGLGYAGFAYLLEEYTWLDPVTRGLATVLVLAVGFLFVFKPPVKVGTSSKPDKRGAGSFLMGFTITALNFALIVSWSAAASALLGTGWVELKPLYGIVFAVAVTIGIGAWYLVLVRIMLRLRKRLAEEAIAKVVQWMGVFLLCLGIWLLWRFVSYFLPH